MKLATRLSAFFLAALAVILIGNSLLLFAVARFYLYRQFDEQLQSSLRTLVAAVEVEDDDVKWEPSDHTVTLGSEGNVEDIRWVVSDETGRIVDRSRNLQGTTPDNEVLAHARGERDDAAQAEWQFLEHRLAAPHPKTAADRTSLEHEALTVLVARRLSDLYTTLRQLAILLIVLPALCWLISALAGRWFGRHAIAPVRQMARSAHGIRADDTRARLAVPATNDELEELGIAFNNLLDHLFAAYDRQRRFAGDAAHQLRTPLTVLQGQVEVALRRPRSAEEYEMTLQVVGEEVASFRQTVEGLLFLARSRHEQEAPDAQPLDMTSWLERYLQRWKADPRWSDIHPVVVPGLRCATSPSLLNQLLDILISNALKYSPDNSPVEIRIRQSDDNLVWEVEDRGTGIGAADVDSIFQPFYRAKQARQSGQPGIGLGLAIAARIAEVLGGTLRCQSQPGAGTRFTFALPLAAMIAVAMPASKE